MLASFELVDWRSPEATRAFEFLSMTSWIRSPPISGSERKLKLSIEPQCLDERLNGLVSSPKR
jgi:hypothetical protein